MSSDSLHDTIGHMRGTLESNTRILQEIRDWMDKHEEKDDKRFASLEEGIGGLKGKMIFGSGFIAAVSTMITLWFKGH